MIRRRTDTERALALARRQGTLRTYWISADAEQEFQHQFVLLMIKRGRREKHQHREGFQRTGSALNLDELDFVI